MHLRKLERLALFTVALVLLTSGQPIKVSISVWSQWVTADSRLMAGGLTSVWRKVLLQMTLVMTSIRFVLAGPVETLNDFLWS